MKQLLAFNIGDVIQLKGGESIRSRFPDLKSVGAGLISPLVSNIYVLAGVVMFFLLIGGGLTVIISAGQNRPDNVGKGQKAITAALIGFLVIFASYWIVQIIEYITGLKIISK